MRASDGPQLLGVLAGVARGPPDHLADLGLPVAVQDDDAEAFPEAARLQRRQRRGDAADVPQRCEVGHVGLVEHRHRGGRQHRRPDAVAGDRRREAGRVEAVQDHDRRTGAQPEQDVVDAGVERERHRDEVRGGGARTVGGPAAPQGREDAVEQLEVLLVSVPDRSGSSGRPRRPRDERDPRVARWPAPRSDGDATVTDHRAGPGGVEQLLPLGARRPDVDRDHHGTDTPDREHRDDEPDPVGQDDRDGIAGADPGGPQLGGPCVHRVGDLAGGQLGVVVGEQEVARGSRVLVEERAEGDGHDRGTASQAASRYGSGSRGSPRTFSPRTLRLTSVVPPSIVLARLRSIPATS